MSTDAVTGANAMPADLFSLQGRIAFVSGAGGHLGRAMATALAGAGAHVILNGRNEETLATFASELTRKGHAASILPFDVASEPDRKRAVEEIGSRFGRLDVIVNNAYHGRTGTVDTATPEDFDRAFSLNVTSAFSLVQHAKPLLAAAGRATRGGASVINVGSMYGIVSPDPAIYGDSGSNNPPFYGPSKAALLQLTRYLACHLASDRIRVNSVSPGPFPRPEVRTTNPSFYAALCAKNPMKRIGEADEVGGPVLFLASDAASFVTGADLRVDGGWTAW